MVGECYHCDLYKQCDTQKIYLHDCTWKRRVNHCESDGECVSFMCITDGRECVSFRGGNTYQKILEALRYHYIRLHVVECACINPNTL